MERGGATFKGYTADEIIGKHFSLFYTAEEQKTGLPRRALETAATEGRFEQEGWRPEMSRIIWRRPLPPNRHCSRISRMPPTMRAAAVARTGPNGSFRTTTAMAAANSTLVSRKAATRAIGATVIAQMAIQ